jgi:NAD(P)-dependent dehydrogenase (short-subunit alcohol dehydrogenase family)
MTGEHATRRPTVFVTGASQGIGAAIALTFARGGYDVAAASTRLEKLDDVAARIAAAGARAVPVALDVRIQSGIEQAMATVVAAFGELDVLVNNAAVTLGKLAVDVTPAEWNNVIATNLTGTFFMSQQMGRHLIAGKRTGCIISITSTHGVVGFANRSTYGITKAGVMHMTRMLAVEWAAHGIRVNSIAPGTVSTPSREAFMAEPGYREMMLNRIPLHRLGTPEEIADAAYYLASPQAAYITGQTLLMDGGLTSY